MSESEYEKYESPVKKRGYGHIKELMTSSGLKGEVCYYWRQVSGKKISGSECEFKSLCTGIFISNNRENSINTIYSGRPKNG